MSIAAWVVVVLFGVIAWFLRREINNNDKAHRELNADVKRLLEGQGEIKSALAILTGRAEPGRQR